MLSDVFVFLSRMVSGEGRGKIPHKLCSSPSKISSIAIQLTFATPQIDKSDIKDYRAKTFIRSKQIKATQTLDSTQLCKYVCLCLCDEA